MHEHKGGALTETTLLILLSLQQPNHGYGMMQFVKEATMDRVQLGAGTLYGALNTLEAKGWITPLAEFSSDRKKQYVRTALGTQQIVKEMQRLQELLTLAQSVTKEYTV